MHAAQVLSWEEGPKYVEIPKPELPSPESGLVQIKILAVGIHQVVRSRASGKHYSSTTLPHLPGVDGVGVLAEDPSQKVYFSAVKAGGSYAEYVNIPKNDVFPLPEGLDPVQTTAMLNPGLSSWMAIRKRCYNLPSKFTVLILGASTASGRVAVSLLPTLGAGTLIGCGRNEAALKTLGLDKSIVLKNNVEETDFASLPPIDVVLDYLNGPPALHLLKSLPKDHHVQFVQIGNLAGTSITLPGPLLRSKDVVLSGSGFGSWNLRQMRGELAELLQGLTKTPEQEVKVCKLQEVAEDWKETVKRIVFVP